MVKFTYSKSQRLHNSFSSKLIQSIINPLILFGIFAVILLLIYRSIFFELGDQFLRENSLSKESNIRVVSTDFSILNKKLDLSDLLNEGLNKYTEGVQFILQNDINSTCAYLNQQHEHVSQIFNQTLELKLNESQEIARQQSQIQDILISLNSSIIDILSQDKSNIDALRSELENAVYVGDTVDTSNLSLNYDTIQQSLGDVIAKQNTLSYDDSTILALNDTKADFLDKLEEIFENATYDIQNYDTTVQLNKTSYAVDLTPIISSTHTAYLNGTSNASIGFSSQTSSFKKDSSTNLITIGIFLFITYLLIMVCQYFKFRYHSNYIASRLIDLEKSETKIDYLGVLQSASEPAATMITDFQSQISSAKYVNNSDRFFWINSYLFGESSNLPYLLMMGFVLLILMLSLGKMKWEITEASGSKYSTSEIQKSYNLTDFDELGSISFNSSVIEDYNSNIYSHYQTICDSITDLFMEYNITQALSLAQFNMTHHDINVPLFQALNQSSLFLSNLNHIEFQINTKIDTSNLQTPSIISVVLVTIQSIFTHTVRTALIAISITFMILLSIGFLYSFLV